MASHRYQVCLSLFIFFGLLPEERNMTIEEKILQIKEQREKIAKLQKEAREIVHENVCAKLDEYEHGGCIKIPGNYYCTVCREVVDKPLETLKIIEELLSDLISDNKKQIKGLLKVISSLKE